jgi:hypothetical protein
MNAEPVCIRISPLSRLFGTLLPLFFSPGALTAALPAAASNFVGRWPLYGLVGLALAGCLLIPAPHRGLVSEGRPPSERSVERLAQDRDSGPAPEGLLHRWNHWRAQRASGAGLHAEARRTQLSSQAIVWYLLVPVPILLLGLLYAGQCHAWSLHVDFALRMHSFVVLLMALQLAVEALLSAVPLAPAFTLLRLSLLLWSLVWLWLALRRVYGASVLGTSLRALALVLLGYAAVLTPAALALSLARRLLA